MASKKPLHIICITQESREDLVDWIQSRAVERRKNKDLPDIFSIPFDDYREEDHSNRCLHPKKVWRRNDKKKEYKFEECMGKDSKIEGKREIMAIDEKKEGETKEETKKEKTKGKKEETVEEVTDRLLKSMKPIEMPVLPPSRQPPPIKGRRKYLQQPGLTMKENRALVKEQIDKEGAKLLRNKKLTKEEEEEKGWRRGGRKTKRRKKIKKKTRRKRN